MNEIIHQRQPTHNSCMSTCFAMLADIPVQSVIDKWHEHIWTVQQGERKCFDDLGIVAVPVSTVVRSLYRGCVYLIAAQSLNHPQSCHQIILDCRWDDGYKIFDPQFGNADAKYYVPHHMEISEHLEPNAVKFEGGWHVDYRILDCPVFNRR